MAGLALTPELLEGAYEYLRLSLPFRRWHLPDGGQIVFRVLGAKVRYGHFRGRHRKAHGVNGISEIAISAIRVKSNEMRIATMAHEMIHLYQDESGMARGHQNRAFRKLAVRICAIHGFRQETF